ncbi:integrase, catalytic region, zinc finger, CCHC-type containing protein [Tanacetum coccineum]|uniref:Integrase, catalytic region, zinc finger, CCHC-type containing protein n=1 Tax=Tanacetum coccineum TaxID=301880 RepID=A0ABQ5GA96_9ASTR
MAVIEDCWFQAMQDEIHEFDRLEVCELVPRPIYVMVIALKWIYKVKLDEYGEVLKNKARRLSLWANADTKGVMTMMGQMAFFLGLQVSQSPRGIFINQAKYALETLKKYGMDLSDPCRYTNGDDWKLGTEDLMGIPLTNSI